MHCKWDPGISITRVVYWLYLWLQQMRTIALCIQILAVTEKGITSLFYNELLPWKDYRPPARQIPGVQGGPIPYFSTEDEAFSVDTHLLRPYGGTRCQ